MNNQDSRQKVLELDEFQLWEFWSIQTIFLTPKLVCKVSKIISRMTLCMYLLWAVKQFFLITTEWFHYSIFSVHDNYHIMSFFFFPIFEWILNSFTRIITCALFFSIVGAVLTTSEYCKSFWNMSLRDGIGVVEPNFLSQLWVSNHLCAVKMVWKKAFVKIKIRADARPELTTRTGKLL